MDTDRQAELREIYRNNLDFSILALQDKDFNRYLKSNGQLDFSNPEAVSQLTKSLLKRDFSLDVELPGDRLCPPVPNRFNYLIWIQDLLDSTSPSYSDGYDDERDIVGLDIGTGASCIYPLLGCAIRPRWKFGATDIDAKNLEHAKRNILTNNLKSRIRPLQTSASDPLIPLDDLGLESIDFTMCNPPFYSSSNDLEAGAASKSRPPHSACTGSEVEMVTPGGEVAFVRRMITESEELGDRCQWFTSMLGKSSSVEASLNTLTEMGITNWAIRDLVQGNKTRRWAIAWSWQDLRPSESAAATTTTFPRKLLPFPPQFSWKLQTPDIEAIGNQIDQVLKPLQLRWLYKPLAHIGLALAPGNVWSRAARRKKERGEEVLMDTSNAQLALGVKVSLEQENGSASGTTIDVRWVRGSDSVLFESFCGMLKRQLDQR